MIPKRKATALLGTGAWLTVSTWMATIAKDTIQLRIDPGCPHQTIDGFGASDAWRCQFVGKHWPVEKRQSIADLLFSQEVDAEGNPITRRFDDEELSLQEKADQRSRRRTASPKKRASSKPAAENADSPEQDDMDVDGTLF